MERSHGEEGVEDKCRKDKGHDMQYKPGSPAEFWPLSSFSNSK